MKEKWQQLAARFDALARRERAMIAAATLVAIGFLGYSFLVEPQLMRAAASVKTSKQAAADMATMQSQLLQLRAKLKDPDAGRREDLARTREAAAKLDARLRDLSSTLVAPERMQAFLGSLLARNPKLELRALRTLPPTLLIERSEEKKDGKVVAAAGVTLSEPLPNLYKHGIEIRIAGSYNDLLYYLEQLEGMPNRILWNKLVLVAEQYPRNVMTLTVFTLSLNRQWLIL